MADHSLCVKWSLLRPHRGDTEGEWAARNTPGVRWQCLRSTYTKGLSLALLWKPRSLPRRSFWVPSGSSSPWPRIPRASRGPKVFLSFNSSVFPKYRQQETGPTQVIIIFEPQRGWRWAELGLASPFKRELKHSNSNLLAQLSLQLEMWRFSINIRHWHPNQHQTALLLCFLGSEKYQLINSKNIFSKNMQETFPEEGALESTVDFQWKWKTKDRTYFFFSCMGK